MPYSVRKYKRKGYRYAIYKKVGGRWVLSSRHRSKAKAESARRVKEGVHRGWKRTGRRRRKKRK